MKRENGFSLIELMIVIALIAIVTAIAIPSFTAMIKKNRMASQVNNFIATLNVARSEAIKRNLNVIICRSADGTTCATAGGWEQGWIVFADTNPNGNLDAGDLVLVVQRALTHGSTLRPNATYSNSITYLPRGYVTPAAATGGFILCPDDGDRQFGRAIMISLTGRPSIVAAPSSSFATCYP